MFRRVEKYPSFRMDESRWRKFQEIIIFGQAGEPGQLTVRTKVNNSHGIHGDYPTFRDLVPSV